jgi:hypothetical protein
MSLLLPIFSSTNRTDLSRTIHQQDSSCTRHFSARICICSWLPLRCSPLRGPASFASMLVSQHRGQNTLPLQPPVLTRRAGFSSQIPTAGPGIHVIAKALNRRFAVTSKVQPGGHLSHTFVTSCSIALCPANYVLKINSLHSDNPFPASARETGHISRNFRLLSHEKTIDPSESWLYPHPSHPYRAGCSARPGVPNSHFKHLTRERVAPLMLRLHCFAPGLANWAQRPQAQAAYLVRLASIS